MKDDKAAIWGNDRKEKDSHPDFRGQATIAGVEYWVSAWRRGPDANPKAPALRLIFTRKDERRGHLSNDTLAAEEIDPDDLIPF